jgi:hypothetical protein
MDKHIILGVHVTERLKKAVEVQSLLSQYGCSIKTRLGLHEVGNVCSPNGLLLLEMWGEDETCFELADKLAEIEGIEVQKMVFTH